MNYIRIKAEVGGMCSQIWQTLRAIYHNPHSVYYIDWGNSLYYSNEDHRNPYEYYFRPIYTPTNLDYEIKTVGNIEHPDSEYRDVFMENPTESLIYESRYMYYKIIKANIHLTDELIYKISDFYNKNLLGYSVVGCHIRGTDHPNRREVEDLSKYVLDILKVYDKIFLMSDEQTTIDYLSKVIPNDKLIIYDAYRSSGRLPTHHSSLFEISGNSRKKMGEDVVVETWILSKCNFLIFSTNSNVNYLARAINPTLKYKEL